MAETLLGKPGVAPGVSEAPVQGWYARGEWQMTHAIHSKK